MELEHPKETPLKLAHLAAGARMVNFAGWFMPVQYSGIREEHLAVRERVGVFDISHMGQIFVEGPGALAYLEGILTNRVADLELGYGQYTLMLNAEGGVIDDLIIYRLGQDRYFLVVNASMIEEDAAWMRAHLPPQGVEMREESDAWAGLAVQGPQAGEAFKKAIQDTTSQMDLPPRNGITSINLAGDVVLLCRTGYTGEDGFEFFCPAARAEAWWQTFLDAGCTPCGLGARDTLRLEMGYPLNGSDLSPARTPIEAGLKFFVKLDKGEFVGRPKLVEQVTQGPDCRLAALRVVDKAPPPRPHYPVWHDGQVVGELTSGTLSPSLNVGIAMAYLPAPLCVLGSRVSIEVRGRRFDAEIVKKPFYKRPS